MITALDKNTALVLIDLQKGTLSAQLAHPAKAVLANAARLLDAFRNASLPVVIVHVNPVGAPWTKTRKQVSMIPADAEGQKAAEAKMQEEGFFTIVPEIMLQPGDLLVTKKTWNAFYETGLHDELQKRNVTGIVLGGVSTSVGVEGTARAASELGYNITLASDATTDRIASAYEHSVNTIFPRISEVDTTDAIIKTLNGK
ncbi:isochorismatase family protein [Pinibacter aurantiacus]|uniref:Isochorismatase family protein n=1 Tax=Pinibacter aurantiacus TaxID=2851599 RepID=A0A9E2SC55_9BACT|nr:isochorismatase family protein [Pinibacter aurantiacus]MBV4358678.1 isochorismatase family protein [Pinibacter aurantiacus]